MNDRLSALSALAGFNGRTFEAHHPDIVCVTCIDAREKAGGHFDFGDNAVRVTEIAAVIPPYRDAPYTMRAKFSFAKIKNVSTIKINGHSFCGGAQAAIANPDLALITDLEVRDIVHSVTVSGIDLPRLTKAFTRACEGNTIQAANLLSRHLTLVSLDNASQYPNVNSRIMEGKLDMVPLYHDLKEGTGEVSHLERFDVALQEWINVADDVAAHMCDRPEGCGACASCHSTIETSLRWAPLTGLVDGKVEIVEVPAHLARLIQTRRQEYQPRMAEYLKHRSEHCYALEKLAA